MATKHEAVRKVLNTHFIFSRLTEEGKTSLEPLFELEKYNAGDVIAEVDQPMTGVYSVYSGSVRFKGYNEDGVRVSLGEQPEDTTFGEVALLRDAVWENQVVASTEVILIKLSGARLREFMQKNPALEAHLQKQIGVVELRKRLRGILGNAHYPPELANEILANIGVKKIAPGKSLFRQGDNDPRLYYIETGSVELVRDMIEGTAVLEKVSKGSLIGEEAALTGQPQTYSAVAVTDVTVLVIKQAEVQKILQTNFELKEKFEQHIRQLKDHEKNQANSIKRAEGADQRIKIDAISESEFKSQSKLKDIDVFKVTYQGNEAECVPACLAMITQYYGKRFTLGQCRELTSISSSEATLPQVCSAAETMGFRAKPYRCKFEQLQELELPCIILWENYHYVVLHKARDGSVKVADPQAGSRKMSRKEFEAGWDGTVIVMEPTQKFTQLEPPKSPLAGFIGYLLPYRMYFLEAFIAAVVLNLLGLATPLFIQNIVDKVVVHNDHALLNMMLMGMAMVSVFSLMTSSAQSLLLAHTIARIDMKMMSEFYRHVLSLPMKFFLNRQIGDILTRFGENQKIRGIIAGSSITVVLNTMMIFLYLMMMFLYSPHLTIMVLVFIPIYIINTLVFTPKLKKISNELFLSNSSQQSHLIESLHGVEAIKSTANEYYARAKWEDAFVEKTNLGYKAAKISLLFNTFSQLINLTSTITILWYGANEVMESQMTIGGLMGFNMLMGSVMGPIMSMVGLWGQLQEIRIAMDRVNDVNQIKPEQEPVSSPERMPVILSHMEGRLDFRNVKFRYGGEESPLILNNFNLTIQPGQTVALVGPSGCGKSTVIKMVMGFNMPISGECLIDGKDLMALDLGSFRRNVGVVLQDSFLFSETVAGNIALGESEPDMNAVREAARLSSADDFIVRLPLGYQTRLGEKGISVSGGQRQRICIARALYRRPKILIFDEATSALDNESEQRIQQNMKSILKGKTAVVIAHRLSTIRDADYICFMENGVVLEKGTHDELVAAKGRYYQLAKKQFNLA